MRIAEDLMGFLYPSIIKTYRVVFFYCSALKMTKCQTLRYFVKVGFMVYMAESALGVTPGQVSLRFA